MIEMFVYWLIGAVLTGAFFGFWSVWNKLPGDVKMAKDDQITLIWICVWWPLSVPITLIVLAITFSTRFTTYLKKQ